MWEMSGCESELLTADWRKLLNGKLHDLCCSLSIFGVTE